MFPDSTVCKDVTMASTKLFYVISHSLGPHFHMMLVSGISTCTSGSFSTSAADETSTAQTKKQPDLHACYWSESSNKVAVHLWGMLRQ